MSGSFSDLSGLSVSTERVLAAILDATARPLWVVDAAGIIRFANPAALRTLGYDSADELFGRRSHETIHHTHPDGTPYPAEECPMLRPRTTGETVSSDLDWFLRRDGSMFPVSYVSVPIGMPQGRGAVVVFSDIEERLARDQAQQERDALLRAQQQLMRRVAAHVTGGASPGQVFDTVAEEVGRVLETDVVVIFRFADTQVVTVLGASAERPHPFAHGTHWPLTGLDPFTQALASGQSVRIEDFGPVEGKIASTVRELGVGSGVYAPLVVQGAVWGVIGASRSDGRSLAPGVESRLREVAELVTSAIANTASRMELARLADEQAALRRVATLVARGVPPAELFAAVTREVGELLDVDSTHMGRYERDGTVTGVASWSRVGANMPLGSRPVVEGGSVTADVVRTGRPARIDSYEGVAGPIAEVMRGLGIHSSAGTPIHVDQQLWGVMVVSSTRDEPLPGDAEGRMSAFTQLVATALSNAEARAERRQLVAEQAALRRVATLVAENPPQDDVFEAVATEVGQLLDVDHAGVARFESATAMTEVAQWARSGEVHDVAGEGRWPIGGDSVSGHVHHTGRPARIDDYTSVDGPTAEFNRAVLGVTSSVGAPVVVEGRLWGSLFAHSCADTPLPHDTEDRLMRFAELVATAISNAAARADVRRLADEQAALRRIATLVAREALPSEVFDAVARALSGLLDVAALCMVRFDDAEGDTVVARWGSGDADGGPELATPIVVQGRPWGTMIATGRPGARISQGTETRMGEFTALIATAIANVDTRTELAASRARVIEAADDERRRVVRDLHAGAQERLVHAIVTLKLADRALERHDADAPELVARALDQAEAATAELRELVHGILPGVLSRGGLRAAVEAVASRMPVPVTVEVDVPRLPEPVEATAYFVVAEALANVARHSGAPSATVRATASEGCLRIEIEDDGTGGAAVGEGGLLGLRDRLATLDGRLAVDSPDGGGTRVTATIPLVGDPG